MMSKRISKKMGLEKQIRVHYLGKTLRSKNNPAVV